MRYLRFRTRAALLNLCLVRVFLTQDLSPHFRLIIVPLFSIPPSHPSPRSLLRRSFLSSCLTLLYFACKSNWTGDHVHPPHENFSTFDRRPNYSRSITEMRRKRHGKIQLSDASHPRLIPSSPRPLLFSLSRLRQTSFVYVSTLASTYTLARPRLHPKTLELLWRRSQLLIATSIPNCH